MATAIEKREPKTILHSLLEEHSEELLNCVHCGLCLPSCPTYRALGNENDSPRGRVYLMRGFVEGRLELGDTITHHLDLCLGCRACETACPSGVPYGHLLEFARAEIVESGAEQNKVMAWLVGFVLNQVFTRPRLLRLSLKLARWFRDSGFADLAYEAQLFGERIHFALALLLSSRSLFAKKRQAVAAMVERSAGGSANHSSPHGLSERELGQSARPTSRDLARVGVLRGCVMEGLFTETNRATERVLRRNDCEIAEVKGQMCCGALHAHAGHFETAKALARKNIEAFLEARCETVVVNSAGCGAAMKEYKDWLADDREFADKAQEFSAKVKDVAEFLVARGIAKPERQVNLFVTYDAPCHLMHAQRIVAPPIELLKAIPGLRFRTLAGAENCCGGAGIYNLQHPVLSAEILSGKLNNIRATGADVVATANPGCIMQIGAGLRLSNLGVAVAHPIELLDAAYGNESE
jgi:glycolate oxidase iron-sulfur subunit